MKSYVAVLSVAATLLGACDSSPSKTPDAGRGAADAAVDGPRCGGGGAVTVRGPVVPSSSQVMLAVTSHDETGALCNVATGGSGSDAQMTIDAPPGGMVSMIVDKSPNDGRHIMTWTEVQPGDMLVFPSARGASQKLVFIDMSIPAVAGVTLYYVYVQCGHGAGFENAVEAGALSRSVVCPSDAQQIAVMVQASDGTVERFAVSPPTRIAAIGATTLTLGAWMVAAPVTATVHGASAFDNASASFLPSPDTHDGSTSFPGFGNSEDPVVIGPRGVPSTWSLDILVRLSSGSLSSWPPRLLQLGRKQVTPASLELSVETDFLPIVDAELKVGMPRPQVAWSLARPANADAVFINVGEWLMVTRAQPGTVRFPELPQNLLPTAPAALREVDVVDAAALTSFDQLRCDPLQAFADLDHSLSSYGTYPQGLEP